jgi:hypothetical protein
MNKYISVQKRKKKKKKKKHMQHIFGIMKTNKGEDRKTKGQHAFALFVHTKHHTHTVQNELQRAMRLTFSEITKCFPPICFSSL